MNAREELISLLRTTMDGKDATTVADAYRAEVLREAAQKILHCSKCGISYETNGLFVAIRTGYTDVLLRFAEKTFAERLDRWADHPDIL